jgi:hypothetical protein
MNEIGLGDHVEDTISGYRGIVTCVAHYLHANDRLCVVARSEGKINEEYFDRGRLIKID